MKNFNFAAAFSTTCLIATVIFFALTVNKYEARIAVLQLEVRQLEQAQAHH